MAPVAVATQQGDHIHEPQTYDEVQQFRDVDVEALKEQLEKLKQELRETAAERDYLRYASSIREGYDNALQRRRTQDSQEAEIPTSPKDAPGMSLAARVDDPRIGKPKRILVVGGGPAGIISLHELLNPLNRPEGETMDGIEVHLYERRAEVGGVWYFEPGNDVAKGWRSQDGEFVQSNKVKLNGSIGSKDHSKNGKLNGENKPRVAPWWPTPAYDGLVGNALPPLVEFTAKPMPTPKEGLFPSMDETFSYMYKLAAPLREHVTVHREVTSIQPSYVEGRQTPVWLVQSNDWNPDAAYDEDDLNARRKTEEFDAVIVAAGAFNHPFYPPTPGLEPLLEIDSPLVMHAKKYPGPLPFLNRRNRIVVVGNANSANDVAAHLAPLNSEGPLFRSIRSKSRFAHLPDNRIVDVAPIVKIEVEGSGYNEDDTLTLHLEDGNTLTGITKLIFACGYEYQFDWIKVPSLSSPLFTAPSKADINKQIELKAASYAGAVPNLHLSTFMSTAPTLVFIGLGAGSAPCPLAEIQARAASRVFHGLLSLPAPPPASANTVEAQGNPLDLLKDFQDQKAALNLEDNSPHGWRGLHMIRGHPERKITSDLLDFVEESEPGASEGLFRWDAEREGVIEILRSVKESELRRLRDKRVASGGVDGGVGGVLAISQQVIMRQGRAANGGYYNRGMAVGL